MNNTLFYKDTGIESERIIYTTDDFAKTELLFLQETGTLRADSLYKSQRNNLASYLFFLVQEGMGEIEYCGRTYDLCSGDCVFIDCKKPYSHSTSNKFWVLKWVHFYGLNMDKLYGKYISQGGKPQFRASNSENYRKLLEQIYSAASSNGFINDMRINEKLSALLVLLMEEAENLKQGSGLNKERRDVTEIKKYLEQNYAQKISLDELSRIFYLDKCYMLDVFRKQYGTTIYNYLIHIRIDAAKQLLRFDNMTIQETGYRCGIRNANYFSRIFKKIEGISPNEYRKSWQEK